jgi:hypothetical protein
MGAPKGFWECKNCGDYNPDDVSVCPNCKKGKDGKSQSRYSPASIASRVSSSTVANSNAAANTSTSRNYYKAQGSTGYSHGASFMNICSWIIWIGGGLASILLSLTFDRYGDIVGLNFGSLITYALVFGIAGFTYMVLGELFQNIANIAASLQNLTITQTEYRNDPNTAKMAKDIALIADTLRSLKEKQNEHQNDAATEEK